MIIEFKVQKEKNKKDKALAQIHEKQYFQKYLAEAKAKKLQIMLAGISFDSQEKNIIAFETEQIV